MEEKQTKAGFSLVELLLILSIFAILILIEIPDIRKIIADYKLKEAASDLFFNIHFTKAKAVKEKRNWAIFFDYENNAYLIYSNDKDDGSWTNQNETIEKKILLSSYGYGISFGGGDAKFAANTSKSKIPDDAISYASPDNIAIFNTFGMNSNLGYLYLKNCYNTAFSVGTPTVAGQVILKKWRNNAWQ